jgi:hypothetical protein
MIDLLKLILGVLASLFRSRAKLEAEILILRQQINVLRRRAPKRPHLNNTDRFLFVWLYHWFPLCPCRDCDCQARDDHSLAPYWVSGVLALAVAQPCWPTKDLGWATHAYWRDEPREPALGRPTHSW